MKINKTNISFLITSILLGIIISMNINIVGKEKVLLSAEDYSEQYNKRNKLYKEITNMKDEYYNAYNKVEIYKANDENKYATMSEIEKELEYNKKVLGLTAVEGEGVNIIINDAATGSFGSYYDIYSLVHDADILGIMNDLRNAGAEAVSINGQRIIFKTYSYCGGTNIDLGGMKIVAPFYINAIGNKKVIKNYLILNDTRYKRLASRGIRTEIQETDNIKIPAYIGKIKLKYIEK